MFISNSVMGCILILFQVDDSDINDMFTNNKQKLVVLLILNKLV